ncbi:MAG: excinuclease ABC subunit UvrC, partial [Candidatus Gracilibacteria bacterium]
LSLLPQNILKNPRASIFIDILLSANSYYTSPVKTPHPFKSILAHLPHAPGVYQYKDAKGNLLYVGKAIDLHHRVSSYFQASRPHSTRLQKLVENTADIQYTVAGSELEALILETNLIKSYRPRYNVLMRDDKSYVYIKVTVNEPFPRVLVVRKLERDGAKYFGPKTSFSSVKKTLEVLRKLFPYRHCDYLMDLRGSVERTQKWDDKAREFHRKRCLKPCVLEAMPEEYKKVVDQILAFFEGKIDVLLTALRDEMQKAAMAREFERAAFYRDRLQSVTDLMSTQRVSAPDHASRDLIGLAIQGGAAYVTLFMFRDGKLLNQENFTLNAVDFSSGAEREEVEVLTSFLYQYYEKATDFPDEILIPETLDEKILFEEWLYSFTNKKIPLITPQRGENKALLDLARDNAKSFARQSEVKWQAGSGIDMEAALNGLKTVLNLPRIPKRIECYDISHLSGTDTVGSMAVFEGGFPKKSDYRHFKLRTVQGEIDDYAALAEVLGRRLAYLKKKPDDMRKPRKKELPWIQKTLKKADLDPAHLDVHKMLVIERKKKIVGMARLKPLEKDVSELGSLWVDPKFRGQGLGSELVRALLAKQKKGKVYILCAAKMLDWYGGLGFHLLDEVPPLMKEKHDFCTCYYKEKPIVMVYRFTQGKEDASFKKKPDLLLIDGGKGQLSAVVEVLQKMNVNVAVASLAKQEEEIFVPHQNESLKLSQHSGELRLLQQLRDEAHRFALKYQHNLREKRMLS